MTNQVIPLLLKEEDCKILGKEWTIKLLNCTTSGVILYLNKYLDSGGMDSEVEEMVREFYVNKRNEMGLSNGEEHEKNVMLIESLRLDTPFAYYTIEELENIRDTMNNVLSLSSESVAYNLPVPSKMFKSIIKEIKNYGDDNQKEVARKLELSPAKGIFYDTPTSKARKTIYKKIVLNGTTIELIRNGIDFLLEQMKASVSPIQWRHL